MGSWNIALSGGIYTKSDGVKSVAADEVADYQGAASLGLAMTHAEAYGQHIFRQASALTRVAPSLNFATVSFKGQTIGTLLGITAATGTTFESVGATATIWELDNTLATVAEQEWLSEVLLSGDNKLFEIWLAAGRIGGDMPISFTFGAEPGMAHDLSLLGSADADGKVIKFVKEQ